MSDAQTEHLYLKIGSVLRRRRKALQVTQDQMCDLTYLSRSTIINIEAGTQHARLSTIAQIASVLDTDLESVLQEALAMPDA